MYKKMRPEMISGFQKARWFNLTCTASTGLYKCNLKEGHTIDTVGIHAQMGKKPTYWVDEFVYFAES